ncbi:MAG: elongation factor P lysine(34) lysyltransferase [Gammaproteobacteria bacterium HGW-Gammaproteobacteria-11]|nr:MAG: elongation factor P lysine(34) lysyltransferase [Gammaproteobacteria bacterium HGW-Gammaproteobacteria-11]
MLSWQPSASIAALHRRAEIVQQVRGFFLQRGVLEVETPYLSCAAVSDPQLHPFVTDFVPEGGGLPQSLFLHTSPEYPMKRLLAAGSGCIWQLCRVFRNGEQGRRHNPEFSMLEWYRLGFDHHQLMDEVDALVSTILDTPAAGRVTYAALFAAHLHIDIHQCSDQQLAELGCKLSGLVAEMPRDGWLNLLFSHYIEPRLIEPTLVYAFPASQAALARIVDGDDCVPVAARFEMFINGMELANGYFELVDAEEQQRRFASDQVERTAMGKAPLPVDNALLAAMQSGLPDCAGVALGLDRLVMLALDAERIDEVIPFPLDRA